MKTYRNLYSQICSFQNLLAAFWKARRHKSSKPYVVAFEFNLEWRRATGSCPRSEGLSG